MRYTMGGSRSGLKNRFHRGEQFRQVREPSPTLVEVTRLPCPCGTQENKWLPGLRRSELWAGRSGEALGCSNWGTVHLALRADISLETWPQTVTLDIFMAKTTCPHCPISSNIVSSNPLERYCGVAFRCLKNRTEDKLSCNPPPRATTTTHPTAPCTHLEVACLSSRKNQRACGHPFCTPRHFPRVILTASQQPSCPTPSPVSTASQPSRVTGPWGQGLSPSSTSVQTVSPVELSSCNPKF